jgi:hypothetical protein
MRRAVLICAVLAVLSPTYAEAAERIWRMGVLALAGEEAFRSVILPYLATRGFVEGRNLVVISASVWRSNCRNWRERWLATNPM